MAITEGTVLRVVASLLFPDDVIMQNVFHLVLTTRLGTGDPDETTLDMQDYINQIYVAAQGNISDDIVGDEIKVYEYDSVDDDFDEVGTGLVTFTPAATGDFLPHGVAALQIFYTTDPDVQGRKFWGGFSELGQADGDWVAGALIALIETSDEVVGAYTGLETGSTYTTGVWSPTNTNFFAYNDVVATPATIAYQRRRKPGVGI